MEAAVITFPGSNCDRDMRVALQAISGKAPKAVWHGETSLPKGLDVIALPGGFSYGDYLRCGAMAAKSPIMQEVIAAAKRGVKVIGVCNGFQLLCESGLLPGVLMRNQKLRFICKDTTIRVETTQSVFTSKYKKHQTLTIPVAHHDGSFYIGADGVKALEDQDQIAFRYCDHTGNVTEAANINGSVASIAGILNKEKNVLGMMPHPERAVDILTAGTDGKALFESLLG